MHLYILTLRKYIADNRRNLLLRLAGLAALMIFMGIVFAWDNVDSDASIFIILMMIIGILASLNASTMFSSMKNPRGRIATLMIPSSAFDKFAAAWTVNILLAGVIFFAGFWLAEATRVITWPWFHAGGHTDWFTNTRFDGSFRSLDLMLMALSSIMANQAFFCFGAIVWPRLSAIKSIIAIWVLTAIFGAIIGSVHVGRIYGIHLDGDMIPTIIIIFNCVMSLILWGLAYMRFAESDIPDRLF